MPVHGGNSERRRQVVDDRVEQRLHALVLERGAADDRHERRASLRTDSMVRWRSAALISSSVMASPLRYFSSSLSSASLTFSMSFSR